MNKKLVKIGDWIMIPEDQFCRGGQWGIIVDIYTNGVSIDFECGYNGCLTTYPQIEFWEWNELKV